MSGEKASIYRFFDGLAPDLIDGVITDVLTNPVVPNALELGLALRQLHKNINFDQAKTMAPSWMNISGLSAMVSELSSSRVFHKLYEALPDDVGDKAMESMVTLFSSKPVKRYTLTLGTNYFSSNFARFMGTELTMGLLAPAIGQNIDTIRNDQRLTFATVIGENYANPPITADEYLSRVRQLIPDPDSHQNLGNKTLFSYMLTGNAFSPDIKKCPGIDITETILKQWGRQLTKIPYSARFQRRITRFSAHT